MIFSAIHMFWRMAKDINPDYSDIGLGFIIMGFCESVILLFLFAGIKAILT